MATVRYYLKLDGITGDAQDEQFKGQIEVSNYSWGVTNTSSASSGTGHSTGPGNLTHLHLGKPLCGATSNLFFGCAEGKHIPKGVLSCVKYAGDEKIVFLKSEYESLYVSSHHHSGHGDHASDTLSLAFVQVKHIHTVQANTGSKASTIEKCWNLQKNKEC